MAERNYATSLVYMDKGFSSNLKYSVLLVHLGPVVFMISVFSKKPLVFLVHTAIDIMYVWFISIMLVVIKHFSCWQCVLFKKMIFMFSYLFHCEDILFEMEANRLKSIKAVVLLLTPSTLDIFIQWLHERESKKLISMEFLLLRKKGFGQSYFLSELLPFSGWHVIFLSWQNTDFSESGLAGNYVGTC